METSEKLEQSEMSKNKGTEFFKVTILYKLLAHLLGC